MTEHVMGATDYLRLAFMAIITALLLAMAVEEAQAGTRGIPGLVVYAFAAGFGLEFVGAVWARRARPGSARRLHG